MDGDSAKAFAWHDDGDEDGVKHVGSFDPAAVLRAIDDEDEDNDAPPPPSARAGRAEADLGAALRAAMSYGDDSVEVPEAEDESLSAGAFRDHEDAQDEQDRDDDGDEDGGDLDALAEPEDEAWIDAEAEDDVSAEAAGDEAGHDDEPDAWSEDEVDAWSEDEVDAWSEDESEPASAVPAAPLRAVRAFPAIDELDVPGRKPRIALMGEFSAGKSTLSNLLIGSAPLPMKVTATQLPPVWISWGDGEPYREDLDGVTHPIDIARLSDIAPSETRAIRIFAKSEILEMCDIIDMPGISDPNMESDVWERVIGKADAVIWCTHATQAWRQSEASVWESLNPALFARSLLLVTRFDKLHGESDRTRVMRRIERETEGLFAARLPISLTEALSAGDNPDLLDRSGAAAFHARLVAILDDLAGDLGNQPVDRASHERTVETLGRDGLVSRMDGGRPARSVTPSRILPRRVRPMSELAISRPLHDDHDPGL